MGDQGPSSSIMVAQSVAAKQGVKNICGGDSICRAADSCIRRLPGVQSSTGWLRQKADYRRRKD